MCSNSIFKYVINNTWFELFFQLLFILCLISQLIKKKLESSSLPDY